MVVPLLLALTIQGEAAFQHASRLAALGPHPWGSPLGRGAAQYVESQLRDAGLSDVRLATFEKGGLVGTNVSGLRPGPGTEIVVIAAHHDTAAESPGAYDDGGGVGILIEVARAMAQAPKRTRSILFVSFDGEEGWEHGLPLAGSNAFVEALGPHARDVVAMIAIEMSGYPKGTPCLHPIPYPDPLRPGRYVVTPAWLVRTALGGGRSRIPETRLGDPYISWLYQPLVRTAQVRLYGDDQAFLQHGIPALMVSDSSFSSFYPWYHTSEDTADKIDAPSLARMGTAVLGMTQAVEAARPDGNEREWFGAFGHVFDRVMLLAAGIASILPGLLAARRSGLTALSLRALYSGGFGFLLWRAPVPALFAFGLANLLAPFAARPWVRRVSLVPLLALFALGVAAWKRGMVAGLWLRPWELAIVGAVVLLALLPPRPGGAPKAKRGGGKGAGKAASQSGRGRRRGVPR